MSDIRVLACVIERNGRFLICLRPAHKRHGGLWEFPGGKVEPGETDLQAAARELEEELGLRVSEVGPPEFARQDPGSRYMIEFVRVEADGEPEPREHQALAWVRPGDLSAYVLAPTDKAFAAFLSSATGEAADSPPYPAK